MTHECRAPPRTREHGRLAGRRSVALADITQRRFAAAAIVTDHDDLDYDAILDMQRSWSTLAISMRGAASSCRRSWSRESQILRLPFNM
jgi:hypothetical protein